MTGINICCYQPAEGGGELLERQCLFTSVLFQFPSESRRRSNGRRRASDLLVVLRRGSTPVLCFDRRADTSAGKQRGERRPSVKAALSPHLSPFRRQLCGGAGLRAPPPVELLCLLINSSRKIGLLTKINFHSDPDYGTATD